MRISVSSYSFQQHISAGKMTLFDTVHTARGLGFEAIEFLDMPGADYNEQIEIARRLRAEADKYGVKVIAYTIGACLYHDNTEDSVKEVERLCRQVDIAEVLGCTVMRHDVCYSLGKSGNSRSFGLMLPTIAANARAVTEYAAPRGIMTCVENHGYIAQDSYRLEQLFNAVAHDNFGLLVDVGNFVCADENPTAAVSRVAPYAVHVHAKDMYLTTECLEGYGQTRGCNYFKGAIVGEGDVDVAKCLAIIHRAGYDGYCSIEFEGSEDCIDAVRRGRENLMNMLKHLA
ncbi:MAG: sugar phosphate isomerase/epimerase [Ruminococcaceae bacterium]|nr:sugar phosphate isomerase/epimerase [Oscillospiraceae bacterium]